LVNFTNSRRNCYEYGKIYRSAFRGGTPKQESAVKKLQGTSQKVKRAIVLLKADADGPNWTSEKIHELTGVSIQTIVNTRKQLVLEGFDVVLDCKKRRLSPVPKKLDGLQEANILTSLS